MMHHTRIDYILISLILINFSVAQGPTGVYDNGKWVDLHDDISHDSQPYIPRHINPLNNTIMVEIAAFRDPRCSATLEHIYTKAQLPRRVFVGIVQQNDDADEDCLDVFCDRMRKRMNVHGASCPYAENIRILRVHYSLGRGPVMARSAQILLNRNEDFCLQIDSHSDFIEHWDVELIKQWSQANNEYAILTTYVPKVEDLVDGGKHARNVNNHWEVPHLCAVHFTGQGMIRNNQAKAARMLKRPKLTNLYAAGLAFGKCHHRRRVPVDPHLPQIFDGEEFSYGLRLFTAGYDMYTPSRNIVFHDYNRVLAGKAKMWTHDYKEGLSSRARLKTLWGDRDGDKSKQAHEHLGIYDVGRKRTLEQYMAFAGVYPNNHTTTETRTHNPRCHRLDWVPYDDYDSDDEVNYVQQSREDVKRALSKYVVAGKKSDISNSGVLTLRGEHGRPIQQPPPPPPQPVKSDGVTSSSSSKMTRKDIKLWHQKTRKRFNDLQNQIESLSRELSEAATEKAPETLPSVVVVEKTNENVEMPPHFMSTLYSHSYKLVFVAVVCLAYACMRTTTAYSAKHE